jgi:hypothetical protein
MSTRANIVLITEDDRAHQFYHHCDGYLSGVGDELRRCMIYAYGMSFLIKDMQFTDILVGQITNYSEEYEDEYVLDLDAHNRLHADIEFLYIVKDGKLYYVSEWDMCHKCDTYKDLVDYVCVDKNMIDLIHPCHDPE